MLIYGLSMKEGLFGGVVESQMNLQADAPLVDTAEHVTVRVRCVSQRYCVLDTAVLLMGKRCFQTVSPPSAERRDLHMWLTLCVLQNTKLWCFSYR